MPIWGGEVEEKIQNHCFSGSHKQYNSHPAHVTGVWVVKKDAISLPFSTILCGQKVRVRENCTIVICKMARQWLNSICIWNKGYHSEQVFNDKDLVCSSREGLLR